jgi:hypothetical protein
MRGISFPSPLPGERVRVRSIYECKYTSDIEKKYDGCRKKTLAPSER